MLMWFAWEYPSDTGAMEASWICRAYQVSTMQSMFKEKCIEELPFTYGWLQRVERILRRNHRV